MVHALLRRAREARRGAQCGRPTRVASLADYAVDTPLAAAGLGQPR